MTSRNSPLFIDIAPELAKVDKGMSALINDRTQWAQFLNNPIGVMSSLGIIAHVPEPSHKHSNEVFYVCLANKYVVKQLLAMYDNFDAASKEDANAAYTAGLQSGEIKNTPNYDLDVIDELLKQKATLKDICQSVLLDLNDRGLLQEKYPPAQLNEFLELLVSALVERKSIKEILDIQLNAGLGVVRLGVVVGPVAVAVAAGQVGVVATAVAAIASPNIGSPDELIRAAIQGSRENLKTLGVLGRLMEFSAELALKVQEYERG